MLYRMSTTRPSASQSADSLGPASDLGDRGGVLVFINRKPGFLKRLVCFVLQICPRCEQSFAADTGGYYVWCQTPGCEMMDFGTKYSGPERRGGGA